jgi:glycosyltransferase involved in cell wall biosynthesis
MITFIATSHGESAQYRPFIDSILAQKDTNWKAIVYNNGSNPQLKEWVEAIGDTRLSYVESTKDTGQWGTINRADAIQRLVDTEYVVNTSVQDYYTQNTVQELNKAIQEGHDLISWRGINHLFSFCEVNGELAFGMIDWGQWCVKTDYIRKTGIVNGREFASDWFTLKAIIDSRQIKNYKKINSILHIHN